MARSEPTHNLFSETDFVPRSTAREWVMTSVDRALSNAPKSRLLREDGQTTVGEALWVMHHILPAEARKPSSQEIISALRVLRFCATSLISMAPVGEPRKTLMESWIANIYENQVEADRLDLIPSTEGLSSSPDNNPLGSTT
jgi:hypothetical protein